MNCMLNVSVNYKTQDYCCYILQHKIVNKNTLYHVVFALAVAFKCDNATRFLYKLMCP